MAEEEEDDEMIAAEEDDGTADDVERCAVLFVSVSIDADTLVVDDEDEVITVTVFFDSLLSARDGAAADNGFGTVLVREQVGGIRE